MPIIMLIPKGRRLRVRRIRARVNNWYHPNQRYKTREIMQALDKTIPKENQVIKFAGFIASNSVKQRSYSSLVLLY